MKNQDFLNQFVGLTVESIEEQDQGSIIVAFKEGGAFLAKADALLDRQCTPVLRFEEKAEPGQPSDLEHKFKHNRLLLSKEMTPAELIELVGQLLKERAMRNMALRPFAKFGKRLMDGRSHVPPSGHWYALDSGCETEASLDIEHFKEAIRLTEEE